MVSPESSIIDPSSRVSGLEGKDGAGISVFTTGSDGVAVFMAGSAGEAMSETT
jgi:hypothetical protein